MASIPNQKTILSDNRSEIDKVNTYAIGGEHLVTKNDDLNSGVDQTEKKLKSAISNLESLSNTITEAFETRDRLVNAIESNKGSVLKDPSDDCSIGDASEPDSQSESDFWVQGNCEHFERKS